MQPNHHYAQQLQSDQTHLLNNNQQLLNAQQMQQANLQRQSLNMYNNSGFQNNNLLQSALGNSNDYMNGRPVIQASVLAGKVFRILICYKIQIC